MAETASKTVSLASNLPHGLVISHKGRKLTVAGGNHPKAIQTGLSVSSKWGITPNVDEEWYDDWVKTHNVKAVQNGLIVKNTAGKIEAMAAEMGDAVKTGVDQVDPDNTGVKGVEKKTEADA